MKTIAIIILAATLALGAYGAHVAKQSFAHAIAVHQRSVA